MPNYTRIYQPGGTYFFTLVTWKRRRILTTSMSRRLLRQAWHKVQAKYPFQVDAVCLVPDHLHCILTFPENDVDFSLRWRLIKYHFSINYHQKINIDNIAQSRSRVKRRELPVWQRRFWEHLIRDEADFRNHIDYIHFNPVKHGIVNRAIDYPWSSFHNYLRLGCYDPDWGVVEPRFDDLKSFGE